MTDLKLFSFQAYKGYIAIFLMFPLYLQSQTLQSEKSFRDKQDSVFQILLSDPASAKEEIDLLISQENQMSDSTKGLNYNLYGIYYNIIGNHDQSIKYFRKATSLLQNYPYRLNKVRTNIGTSLRNNGEYYASIREFEKLLSYYAKENDSLSYAKILGELAANYNYTLNHDKAVSYLTQAIHIFERNNFDADYEFATIIQRLANTYHKQSKFEYAITLYEKSLKLFKETNQMKNYYLTLINLAENLDYLGKKDTALIVINSSIEGLEEYESKNLLAVSIGVKANILSGLNNHIAAQNYHADAYKLALESNSERLVPIAKEYLANLTKLQKYDIAEKVYQEIEPRLKNTNIEYQYSFLLESANYFSNINNSQKALKLSLRSHELKDSSYNSNKQKLVDELQTRFKVQEKQQLNSELKLDVLNKEKNISILTFSIIIALFFILLIIIAWRFRINYQNKIILLEKESNADLIKKLEIEGENLELKQKLIKQQKSELLGYSMEVSNMNEKIESLIKKIENNNATSSLGVQLKSLITINKNWDSFIQRFKEVDPDFIPRLLKMYPNLTQKDLEFCSLVRINISYKDIANFLQISH